MTLDAQGCNDLLSEISDLNTEMLVLQDEIEEEQEFLDRLDEARDDVEDNDLEGRLEMLAELVAEKQAVENKLQELEKEVDELNIQIPNLESRRQRLEQDNEQFCKDVERLEKECEALHEEIDSEKAIIEWVDEDLRKPHSQQEHIDLLSRRDLAIARIQQAIADLDQKAIDLDEARRHCDGTGVAFDTVESELEELFADREKIWAEISTQDEFLAQIEADIAARTEIIEKLKGMIEQVVSWFTDKPITLEEKTKRLEEVEDELKDKEGEYLSHCGDLP